MAVSNHPVSSIGRRRRASGRSATTVALADNVWLAALLLFAVSLSVRLIYLDRPYHFDEFYTFFAAKGVLSDGVPRIADGMYARAELYTRFVAWWLDLFGESFIVARLPSVLAGSLLVVAVFVWTRSVAGHRAAWCAALLVCLSPLNIEMSQFARFYALFGLVFWLGAIGIYTLVTGRLMWPTRLAVAGASGLALWAALHLQDLALLGLAGLASWLSIAVILPRLVARQPDRKRRYGVVIALAALSLVAAAVTLQTDFAAGLIQGYLFGPLHMIEFKNQAWYYHVLLIERYPALWPLFPFIALIAFTAKPKPTIFCFVVFSATFLLLSFAGIKSWRYIFFIMPFLFVIWGIALAASFHALRRLVVDITDPFLAAVAPGLPRRPARWALTAACLLFLIVSSGAPARTLLLPLGIRLNEAPFPDWSAAEPLLEPWLDTASVVLTTHELHALYHLGRFDAVVSNERMFEIEAAGVSPVEIDGGAEFSRDPRTGRSVIGTPEALGLVLDCYPDGLIVTDTVEAWRKPTIIDEATGNLIKARTTPIDLPPALKIKAFRWERPDGAVPPSSCAAVTEFVGAPHPATPGEHGAVDDASHGTGATGANGA